MSSRHVIWALVITNVLSVEFDKNSFQYKLRITFVQWIQKSSSPGQGQASQSLEFLSTLKLDRGLGSSKRYGYFKLLTCGDRVISVKLGQYHDCWCPGSLRRQDIISHDIDYVEYVGPGLTWGWILSTCVISMWSNDIKCKYMFMFPLT